MKRSILIAAMAISMAGAASANHLIATFSPGAKSSRDAELQSSAGKAAPLALGARPVEPRAEPAVKLTAVPVERRAALEGRLAPVPLQVKARPALYVPAADITEAYSRGEAGPSAKLEGGASASSEGVGESAARAAILADGYKAVQVLNKGANGVWRAKAMRGTTDVLLAVDSSGSVTTSD